MRVRGCRTNRTENAKVLPALSGWIAQRHPHGGEHRVVAARHAYIVPFVLSHEHSCLGILDRDSPEVLLALGSHAHRLLSLGVKRPFTSFVLGAFLTVTFDIIVGTAELLLLPALNRASA